MEDHFVVHHWGSLVENPSKGVSSFSITEDAINRRSVNPSLHNRSLPCVGDDLSSNQKIVPLDEIGGESNALDEGRESSDDGIATHKQIVEGVGNGVGCAITCCCDDPDLA